jgi:hypothetical protein
MVRHCTFGLTDDCATCCRCGFKICGVKLPVYRLCDVQPSPGLGDRVASSLSAIGITKERVSKLAGGDCGCAKRQAALNELGRKIGIG